MTSLRNCDLYNNKITYLPLEIKKNVKIMQTDMSTYDFDNLKPNTEILVFKYFKKEFALDNLPYELKELWISYQTELPEIKLPFGCDLHRW
jgi:hypothetical protein